MNRRTKERIDLNLQCRLGPEKVLSVFSAEQTAVIGLTQNLSRNGLLMRWLETEELPRVGSHLTVDIDLPADAAFGRRMMRCRTTVVRIIRSGGPLTVGMRIRNIRFVSPEPAPSAGNSPTAWELETMPLASLRLN
jgi:hypothetical protein